MLSIRLLVPAILAAGVLSAADPLDILPDASLKGWTRIPWTSVDGLQPKVQWRVDAAQHALICAGDGGHEWLRFDKELGDYIFEVDWRFTPKGPDEQKYNGGVGVRVSQYGELWVQAQTTLPGGWLFGNNLTDGVLKRFNLREQMKENRVKPAGEWNHYELRVVGDKVTLAVNGAVVSEATGIALRRGYLGFEAEGFEVTYKNLKLTELK
jgi:hypothetical protein